MTLLFNRREQSCSDFDRCQFPRQLLDTPSQPAAQSGRERHHEHRSPQHQKQRCRDIKVRIEMRFAQPERVIKKVAASPIQQEQRQNRKRHFVSKTSEPV